MSKCILSNNIFVFNKINAFVSEAGFNTSGLIKRKCINVSTFYKKQKPVENFYQSNGGFIAVSGTAIVNGHVGETALKTIFDNFNGDIDSIRKTIIGNYVIVIEKNEKIYVFVDKYSVYNFYYCKNSSGYLLSNNIEFFPEIGEMQLDVFSLFQESFECGVIGNETLFKNVKRLLGYECIVFDKDYSDFQIVPVSFKQNIPVFNTIEEACDCISSKMTSVYKSIHSAFGDKCAINMTGGLDSRLVLAACLKTGMKPMLVHAESNSASVVGTEKGDSICVEKLSKKFGLIYRKLNWGCFFPEDFSHWKDLFYKYGFDYIFYGGNANFHNSYEEWDGEYPSFFDTGLGGEQLRIREAYNEVTDGFKSVDDFITQYQIKGTNSSYIGNHNMSESFDLLERHMIKRWEQELTHYSFDLSSGVKLDDFEGIRYIQHRVGEGKLINYLNQFTCSICVPSIEQVSEYLWGLKRDWRAFAKAQIKVIGNLCADCLDIPFFSHCTDCVFDKKTGTIIAKKDIHEKLGASFRKIGLRNTVFYELLRKIKNRFLRNNWKVERYNNYEREFSVIFPVVKKIIKDEQDKGKKLINIESIPDNDSLIHLIYYAMLLFAYNLMISDYSKEKTPDQDV